MELTITEVEDSRPSRFEGDEEAGCNSEHVRGLLDIQVESQGNECTHESEVQTVGQGHRYRCGSQFTYQFMAMRMEEINCKVSGGREGLEA